MPVKYKSGRRPGGAREDSITLGNRELELEAQVEALKKELDKKDGIHQEELRAAGTALDVPSQKHYIEVLDERDDLQEQLNELQARLDKTKKSTTVTEFNTTPEVQALSGHALVKPQGLSYEHHLLQLIDQHTRRRDHLQGELEAVKARKEKIYAENDLKRREIREIKTRERKAHNSTGDGFHTRPGMFTSDHLFDSLDPPAPSSESAYPPLSNEQKKSRPEQVPVAPPFAYSKVGSSGSQTFKFVNTHLDKGDSKRVNRELALQKDDEDHQNTAEQVVEKDIVI